MLKRISVLESYTELDHGCKVRYSSEMMDRFCKVQSKLFIRLLEGKKSEPRSFKNQHELEIKSFFTCLISLKFIKIT